MGANVPLSMLIDNAFIENQFLGFLYIPAFVSGSTEE